MLGTVNHRAVRPDDAPTKQAIRKHWIYTAVPGAKPFLGRCAGWCRFAALLRVIDGPT
jgi:hypothetical protein